MNGAYYNEFDPRAAAWLRELIREGVIADGEVDERSIADVQPDDLRGFRQCHFFAGIGGWSASFRLAGIPDDAEAWSCSCPCQPFSDAGLGLGLADPRHLWPHAFRLIEARRPQIVIGEQVASSEVVGSELEASFVVAVQGGDFAKANRIAKRLVAQRNFTFTPRWIDGVQANLEGANYTFGLEVLGAHSLRAPHIRQRAWWVAVANGWHPGAEWLQRGGQQRFESQDGGARLGLGHAGGHGLDEHLQRDGRPLESRLGAPRGANADGSGTSEWLADPKDTDGRSQQPESRAGSGRSGPAGDGGDGGMGNSASGGRPWQSLGLLGATDQGHWDRFDLIPCRDGKARRVPQSCVLPVADGVSADLAHLRIARHGHPLTAEKIPGRAALLRGPGNAIVPEVAALFIQASLNAIGAAHRLAGGGA